MLIEKMGYHDYSHRSKSERDKHKTKSKINKEQTRVYFAKTLLLVVSSFVYCFLSLLVLQTDRAPFGS